MSDASAVTVERLMCHKPIELDISSTSNLELRNETVRAISENSENLRALHLGDSIYSLYCNLFDTISNKQSISHHCELHCPQLRVFSMCEVKFGHIQFSLYSQFPQLTYLELAHCSITSDLLEDIGELKCLHSLILSDTWLDDLHESFTAFSKLQELR